MADFNNRLLVYNNEAWVQLLPDGPFSNQAHSLQFSGDKLWVVPGGLTSAWNNANIAPSISVLMPDGWKILNTQNNPLLLNSRDLLSITPHPQNPDQLYISSWGSGLFQVEADGTEAAVGRHFLTPENGLVNIFEDNSRYVRVATSAFDNQGTLWMTNSSVASSLVAYFPEEDRWQRYSYGALSDNQGMAPSWPPPTATCGCRFTAATPRAFLSGTTTEPRKVKATTITEVQFPKVRTVTAATWGKFCFGMRMARS